MLDDRVVTGTKRGGDAGNEQEDAQFDGHNDDDNDNDEGDDDEGADGAAAEEAAALFGLENSAALRYLTHTLSFDDDTARRALREAAAAEPAAAAAAAGGGGGGGGTSDVAGALDWLCLHLDAAALSAGFKARHDHPGERLRHDLASGAQSGSAVKSTTGDPPTQPPIF
jgi:hypothetical protein